MKGWLRMESLVSKSREYSVRLGSVLVPLRMLVETAPVDMARC